MTTYRYSEGPLLQRRQSYSYSEYRGAAFLTAWEASRRAALLELGTPASTESAVTVTLLTSEPPRSGELDTRAWCGYLLAQLQASQELTGPPATWLHLLIQRFEVSKRVYARYAWRGSRLRAVRSSGFDDLELYILAGEVFELGCQFESLQSLNALLKINDSLVALRSALPARCKPRVARMLEREVRHVRRRSRVLGVVW